MEVLLLLTEHDLDIVLVLNCPKERADPNYIVHQQIALMIRWFLALDKILDDYPPQEYPKLPDASATEFETKCFEVLAIIQFVQRHSAERFVLIPGKAVAELGWVLQHLLCAVALHVAPQA